MIRIAIVEDEKDCQKTLQDYLQQYQEKNNLLFQIEIFEDGLDIVENYSSTWDIIFMDIKMKHMDGMQAASEIRKVDSAVILIFITTMAQYAIKGYEVEALDFVLKPVTYGQFATKMQKALITLNKDKEKYILLPKDERKERVSTRDILYIEVKSHNLHIVTKKTTYIMRYPMQEIERDLQDYHFVRCNNPYLINLKHVTGVGKETVLIENYELPMSRTRKKTFLKALSDYFGSGYSER